jgi:hypothetical protein
MRSDLDLGGVGDEGGDQHAAGALAILVGLRVLFAHLRIGRYVANPPLAEAGLYVCILALLIVFL